MKYYKRLIDKQIDDLSKAFGAIQILGPKGCGKTRTAKERAKTIVEFENEDKRDSLIKLADLTPSTLLNNEKPILFDEWQDAPKIWGAIRYAVDKDEDLFGAFLLTGSSSKKVETAHTGTLRIATVEMSTMSLYESEDSNGLISLKDLFDNKVNINGIKSDLSIEDLFYVTSRGGYPRTLAIKDKKNKLLVSKVAYDAIPVDVEKILGSKINKEWLNEILKSYARNISTLAKKSVLYADATSNYKFSEDTFDRYVGALKELYLIKDIDAWNPNLRSKTSIRAPKKHIILEPSLINAIFNLSYDYYLQDFDMFGHIFESLVYRDLSAYSYSLGGTISHYKDDFLEIDFVLHLNDGRYALIEVKLGSKEIEEAINTFKKFEKLIDLNNEKPNKLKVRKPDLYLIITGGEYAYIDRGVMIVPIGCLKD